MRRTGLTRLLPPGLRRLEPQAPAIAAQFSNALIRPTEQAAGEARFRVALLTGCVQDLVFSDINRDTADVLLANGCAVDTPPVQPCCGSLHAHNGETEQAKTLARRTDRPVPAAPVRRHHLERRRVRIAPAALRPAARRRSGLPRNGRTRGTAS